MDIHLLSDFSWFDWLIFGLLVNIMLYLFAIGLYIFIDKTCRKEKIQSEDHPITISDFYLSLLTVILNCVVMWIGVVGWNKGWILMDNQVSILGIVLQVILITLIMDLLMYVFHFIAHLPFFYRLLHQKHHEHVSTNYLSLFVLHPLETLGFGIMMIVVFMLYDFSTYAIVAYLFINLVWGTIGHLNREFFPNWMNRFFVGTSKFHHLHHLDQGRNFGFYTSLWDRLFGTYRA